MGVVWERMQQTANAERVFKSIAEGTVAPQLSEYGYYMRGFARFWLGPQHYPDATKDYLQALSIQPGYIKAIFNLTETYGAAHQCTDARKEYEILRSKDLGSKRKKLADDLGKEIHDECSSP
jgi:hypothetical protein